MTHTGIKINSLTSYLYLEAGHELAHEVVHLLLAWLVLSDFLEGLARTPKAVDHLLLHFVQLIHP